MPGKPQTTASEFLAAFFGAGSQAPVFITSLANERGDGPERAYLGRDRISIDGHVAKYDRPGRGTFFCVGTIRPDARPAKPGGSVRSKENIAEIVCLHGDTDLKSIDLDRQGVVDALLGLEMPPSIIVWSGRGAHSYWLLNEPIDADPESIARVEAMNLLISDVVGGDRVQDVSRLMRLPGSRNTKEGASLPVEVVHMRLTARYEVGDLEEWLDRAGPAIRRKIVEKAGRPTALADNPFLAAAAKLGFKPPIDVEQRLSAMSFQGVGDACIHNTQLAVSASLLARGEDVEDVVDLLLEATKAAAGEDGARWRWDREERTIRSMCTDWVRKHPDTAARAIKPAPGLPKSQARQVDRDSDDVVREGSTGAVVHNLHEERQRREKPAKKKSDDRAPIHVVLGEAVLAAMASRNQAVIFMRKAAWLYQGGLWSMEVDGLKGWLDVQIETACRALGLDGSNRVRAEARGYIQSNPDLWRDEVPWDEHGKIPTRSGLVDPRTLAIEPARPVHYCTWVVDAEYDPAAACPLWEQMIADTFGDRLPDSRAATVDTLRELLGCALIDVKPRALSKALCLVGGSNYGKSGLLEVFSGLFGKSSITAGLESLEGTHGLMAFVRRDPWVLHEAFDQSKWHFSSTVKAIITGEPVPINIKNGPIITTRVRSPIFWGTNHPPQFREATRAIVNRLVVIECRREFREGEFVGVGAEARRRGVDSPAKLVLQEERSGLLNWAIAGLRAALERGSIAVTQEMKASADEIHRDSNLAAGFIEECCEYDRDMRVAVPDFCAAFAVWWLENKGEDRRSPSNEAISKAVVALADRRIASHPKDTRDERRRYYGGLILNRRGVDLWKRAYEAKLFEGKLASTTPADEQVNSHMPESWFKRPSIDAMRRAQAIWNTGADLLTVGLTVGENELSANCQEQKLSGAKTVSAELSGQLSGGQLSGGQPTDASREPEF